MCDYSLMNIPNRLADEGDVLMTHRFPSGSIGLASPEDLQNSRVSAPKTPTGLRAKLSSWVSGLSSRRPSVPAVCIPPGARLRLYGVRERTQRSLGVGPREEVTFTQITDAWDRFRDAVRFTNGRELLLQELDEGLGVQVLSLVLAESHEPDVVEQSVRR